MPQNRVVSNAAWFGCVAGLVCGVEAHAQGMVIQKQPAWNVSAKVVGRVIVQAPQSAQHTLMSKVPGDLFGWAAVAIGDVNTDGVEDVAIAAPMAEGADGRYGCVYVFSGSDGEKIATLWGQPDERFGSGLDVVADADEDGITDVRIAVMDGVLEPDANKERFADGWRVLSSVSGAELSSGGYVDLPEGVQWHAVADDAHGAVELVRIGDSADLDADGAVTEQDFLQLVQIVADAMQSGPGEPGPKLGDVNGDGVVDQVDLSEVAGKVGQGGGGGAYSADNCSPHNPLRPPGQICFDVETEGPDDKNPTDPNPPDEDNPFDPDPQPECPWCDGGDGDGGGGGEGPIDDDLPPDNDDPACDALDQDYDGIRDHVDCDFFTPPSEIGCCAIANSVRLQNDPENEECWGPKHPLLDLDIDTNNNAGLGFPQRSQTEERLEEIPDSIGKIILINDNDDDQDGIPDFADGYDRDGQPSTDDETAEDDKFTPMRLYVSCAAVTEARALHPDGKAIIRFLYSGSDPREVSLTTAGVGATYTPGLGRLRIWTKNADDDRDPKEVSEDGDWIKSDVEYEIEDIGLANSGGFIPLYVEGISPGRDIIGVMLGARADEVPVSVIGYKFVKATENGPGETLRVPEVSTPTPVITPHLFKIINVRAGGSGTDIVGDIVIVAIVRDPSMDLVPGDQGVIHNLGISLNDAPIRSNSSSVSTLDLQVRKGQQNSILAPYPYQGATVTSISGAQLQPGINIVKLTASNIHGGQGFFEQVFEVNPTPPPDEHFAFQISTAIGLLQGGIDLPDAPSVQVSWQYTNGFVTRQNQRVLDQTSTPGVYRDSLQNELRITETNGFATAQLLLAPDEDGAWPALTRDTYLIDQPDPAVETFVGGGSFEDFQRNTWAGYSFNTSVVLARGSQGGSFTPMMIEIVGPEEVREEFIELKIGERPYQVVHENQRTFLRSTELSRPRAFLALRVQHGPLTSYEGEPRRDGWLNYAKGFGVGLMDGGGSFVDGLVELADGAWYLIREYNSISVYYRIAVGEDVILIEDQERLEVAWTIASTMAVKLYEIASEHGDTLYKALHGDEAAMNELGEDFRNAYDLAAEIVDAALDHLHDVDDYEKGRIIGAVMGEALAEVAFSVATGGGGTVLKSASIPRMIVKIRAKLPANLLSRIEPKLVAAEQHAANLAQSVLCFPAGTAVLTPSGGRPIETIGVGDMVVSRNPANGIQSAKPVLAQIRTVADEMLIISVILSNGEADALETTGAHPFYSVNRCEFVPADQLCVGDVLETALPGVQAHVEDIQVARGPPEGQVVYNLMVAEYSTYFAGEAAVWVHNQADTACERVASLFEKIVRRANLRGMAGLERFLQETDSPARRAVVDSSMRRVLRLVGRESLEDTVNLDGSVDLSRIKTHEQMEAWLDIGDRRTRLRSSDVENHHVVPKYAIRYLLRDRDPNLVGADLEEEVERLANLSPSILLHRHDHVGGAGDGSRSFHAILNQGTHLHPIRRSNPNVYSRARVISALESAYTDVGEPAGIPVMKAWIDMYFPDPAQ